MGSRATQPKMRLGDTTLLDDEDNAMVVAHAYLCNQDGVVEVIIQQSTSGDQWVIGYDDSDANPAAGGDIRQRWAEQAYGATGGYDCFNYTMQKGRYFEITKGGTTPPAVTIRWCPFGNLIKCTDYN